MNGHIASLAIRRRVGQNLAASHNAQEFVNRDSHRARITVIERFRANARKQVGRGRPID